MSREKINDEQLLNFFVLLRKFVFSNMNDKVKLLISKFGFENDIEDESNNHQSLDYLSTQSPHHFKIRLCDDDNPILELSQNIYFNDEVHQFEINRNGLRDFLYLVMIDACNLEPLDNINDFILSPKLEEKIKLVNNYDVKIPAIDDAEITSMYDICGCLE
jgi:hypothetical protein